MPVQLVLVFLRPLTQYFEWSGGAWPSEGLAFCQLPTSARNAMEPLHMGPLMLPGTVGSAPFYFPFKQLLATKKCQQKA